MLKHGVECLVIPGEAIAKPHKLVLFKVSVIGPVAYKKKSSQEDRMVVAKEFLQEVGKSSIMNQLTGKWQAKYQRRPGGGTR